MTDAQEVTNVESHEETPVVTRGRILSLALLAAFVWLLLAVAVSSTPAAADDSGTDGGVLFDAVSATIEEISPVPVVTDPVVAVVDRAVEPMEPVIEPVAHHSVAETIAVVNGIIEQAPTTPDLTTGDPTSHTLAEAAPSALEANRPGPAAVRSTAVTPDTRATDVPAAGPSSSQKIPAAPVAPATPVSAPAPSLTQGAGAPSLLADLSGGGHAAGLTGASVAWVDFAVPPSPTFDCETSPD